MKKKIHFILHLPPPVHGASTIGLYLKQSKVVNEAFEADFINLATAFSFENIGKTSLGKISALFRIQAAVCKALLSKKYDLLYVSLNSHGPGFYKDLMVVFPLKLFGKKIVYHFHNKGVAIYQHKTINNLLYRFTIRNTKSILLSRLLYSDIEKYAGKEDVYYCANGIPEVIEAKTIQEKPARTNGNCRLLFLSNMYVAKGVYDLLNACKLLSKRGLDFECHFVGAWSEISEEQLKGKIAQEGLSEVIFIHGAKLGADKYRYYQNTEVFVFPSHNECFPLVNLEAMQFSLPIVTTNVGGIPEMVKDGETGFLVPPQDVEVLAEKLQLLILNPDMRRKMGEAGRKLYESSFTMNAFEANITSVLQSAMMN
jgi:glycosyltransferase involved in cell wall biosynthesis